MGAPGCFVQCAQKSPGGVGDFLVAVDCFFCDACPEDCEQFQPPNLCP
jgi:hypothetical protein